MPRPKSPFPKEKLHISLRQETVARLHLHFYSENSQTGRIHGAISEFVEAAVNEKFERLANAKSS